MYIYQKYILKFKESETERQKNKKYCDGSMQQYLEKSWVNEDGEIKTIILDSLRYY